MAVFDRPSIAKRYALVMGVVFLLIGLLGFVDAFTPDGELFGLFAVNPVHNWIHILSGILGIAAGMSDVPRSGLSYAWFLLIAYGLVTLLGFAQAPDEGMVLGMVHMNNADNWLHLLITLSALAVVVAEQRRPVYRV